MIARLMVVAPEVTALGSAKAANRHGEISPIQAGTGKLLELSH
jgi:hypothetical protein